MKIHLGNYATSNVGEDKELVVFNHYGFWHAMDTLRDKNYLENLWLSKNSPWNYGSEEFLLKNKKILVTGHNGFKRIG